MTTPYDSVLLTGATGLVGHNTLPRLLAADPGLHVFILTRDRASWLARAATAAIPNGRVTPLEGDLTDSGLGLGRPVRRALRNRVHTVVHAAADTVFSRPLDEARSVNTTGTAHLLELAAGWPGMRRFVQVSTAFVAGRLRGRVTERDNGAEAGFVNGYEQSKYEAEALVRGGPVPWVVVRPSVIVCDGADGRVTQFNAVHRALRLYHSGLASMMPGDESSPLDVVSVDYVADCVARLAAAPNVEGATFHACAGAAALGLGHLLDHAYAIWCESQEWRRRGIPRPALTDLATYRLFERSVEDTGDARLRAITQSLSHFVPQLALPKHFDTTATDDLMGHPAPDPSGFWPRMIRFLLDSRWAADARRAA
jgi:thioester reductase-like protein